MSNMVEITDIKDIQKLLYGITEEFHNLCEKHGLYYCAFGGTMLGAVRDGGIIPWDDDIDVCMPRGDYEKLRKIVESEYSNRFELHDSTTENYIYCFSKFCLKSTLLTENNIRDKFSKGMLYIDVFPIDGYPPENEEKAHFNKLRFYRKARCHSVYKAGISKTWWKIPHSVYLILKYIPYRIIGCKYFVSKEIEEAKKYDFSKCEYVSMQGAGWCERGKLAKSVFLNRQLYRFGDMQIYGICDYDEHLTRLYGDYMTPPPEKSRVSNHSYNLYVDKDEVRL